MFLKSSGDEERNLFFEMKEKCKVSCVKIVAWLIVVKEGTNIIH